MISTLRNNPAAVRISLNARTMVYHLIGVTQRPSEELGGEGEPRTDGGFGDSHCTALIFTYQAVALSGFEQYATTSPRGRTMTMSLTASTVFMSLPISFAPTIRRCAVRGVVVLVR